MSDCNNCLSRHSAVFLDDYCHVNEDFRHYEGILSTINISSMFKADYANLAIFQDIQENQLHLLESVLEPCRFVGGEHVFEQGQPATHLYILVSGEVCVNFKPYDGPALTVARIRPGGVFGWSAALGREVYTSGASAERDSEALRLGGISLRRFCESNPEVGSVFLDHLAGVIAERLSNTHAEVLAILTQGMDLKADCWRRIKTHG